MFRAVVLLALCTSATATASAMALATGVSCVPDGVCDWPSENCASCPVDCNLCPDTCARTCGDSVCDASAGESGCTCPSDCGVCCEDDVCDSERGENYRNCAADCGVRVHGVVVDAALGAPLFDAAVRCHAAHTTTEWTETGAASNAWAFPGQLPGEYACEADVAGYRACTTNTTVEPGFVGNTTAVIACARAHCSLVGAVTNPLDDSTVDAPVVTCTHTGAAAAPLVRHASRNGAFALVNTPLADEYTCASSHPRYYDASCTVSCASGDDAAECHIEAMPRPGTVRGTAVDVNGAPYATTVECVTMPRCSGGVYDIRTSTTTDAATGAYDFGETVTPGAVRCTACREEHMLPRTVDVELETFGVAVVDFICQPGLFPLRVFVGDAVTREPCQNAQVTFWRVPNRGYVVMDRCHTDDEGYCTLYVEAPADYVKQIFLRGYEPLHDWDPKLVDFDVIDAGLVYYLNPSRDDADTPSDAEFLHGQPLETLPPRLVLP